MGKYWSENEPVSEAFTERKVVRAIGNRLKAKILSNKTTFSRGHKPERGHKPSTPLKTETSNRTGRPKGSHNRFTILVKDAIIMACEMHGQDGKGKDELVGYMFKLASEEPKSMAMLLRAVMPIHIEANVGERKYRTESEVRAICAEHGVPFETVYNEASREAEANEMIDVTPAKEAAE
jgi:hypothetical protein